ncbi:MAG: hypothetical protein JRI40_09200, partial [Deltaproteobacteria bacterium]|nr:hypothetical protein [Deltaproteobacteria bacterium]
MTDQHNPNIPAAGNVIADDLVDIKENLEFHKDCFQQICTGWADDSAASLVIAADKVSTVAIEDDAVTQDKMADNSVGNAQMRDSAVDTAELAAAAVETAKIADAQITQVKLKTSTGSVTATVDGWTRHTLPGGEYGFYPQAKMVTAAGDAGVAIYRDGLSSLTTSYVTWITLFRDGYNVLARQRYVTSSGEVYWIFILRDKLTKEIASVWQAPDHPSFGNGGKPQLMPHPYPGYDDTKLEIIVINP